MQDKMSDAVAQGVISAEQVAGSILGERCWVRWPFLQEALVQAVSDRAHKVRKEPWCKLSLTGHTKVLKKPWCKLCLTGPTR